MSDLKYSSDKDYTVYLNAVTSVVLVLSTVSIAARMFARHLQSVGSASWDDYLAVFGYLSLFGHIIANYLFTNFGYLTPEGPSGKGVKFGQNALDSTAFLYTFAISGSKLSLLFLIRRIFGTQVRWFKVAWWINFIILFPCWIIISFITTGLTLDRKWSLTASLNYAIPAVAYTNAISDILMLLLPIKMTINLNMSWSRRFQVIGIFCIGFIATTISIARASRAVQNSKETWDPRYSLFEGASLSTPEMGACCMCACLPITRIAFERFGQIVKSSISGSFASLVGSTNRTGVSLRSLDEEPIPLQSHTPKQGDSMDVSNVSNASRDSAQAK